MRLNNESFVNCYKNKAGVISGIGVIIFIEIFVCANTERQIHCWNLSVHYLENTDLILNTCRLLIE